MEINVNIIVKVLTENCIYKIDVKVEVWNLVREEKLEESLGSNSVSVLVLIVQNTAIGDVNITVKSIVRANKEKELDKDKIKRLVTYVFYNCSVVIRVAYPFIYCRSRMGSSIREREQIVKKIEKFWVYR